MLRRPGCEWPLLALVALVPGCGTDDEPAASQDTVMATGDLYDPLRRLEIEIEMPAADWDALREQGFSLFEFQRGQAGDFEYTFD